MRNNMKIGLLTHHWPANFGCNLQALATYRFLKNASHEVTVLNYRPLFLEQRYQRKVSTEQIDEHNKFCMTFLNQSPILRSESEIVDCCNELCFDLILIGSDTLFRLCKEMNTDEGAFPNPFWVPWLNKLMNRPKICAISVSCGGSMYPTFPKRLQQDILHHLANFDFISTRDRWTRWMILFVSRGEIKPSLTPDPTSILGDVFPHIAEKHFRDPRQRGKYILLGIAKKDVDYQWFKSFVEIAHSKGYQVYGLPHPEGFPNIPVDEVISLSLSPLDWYCWIKYSSGFIGERFHPIVCCIYNQVPFISIDNNYGAILKGHVPLRFRSKQYDLCKNFGQGDYCIPYHNLIRLDVKHLWYMLIERNSISEASIQESKRMFCDTMAFILGGR